MKRQYPVEVLWCPNPSSGRAPVAARGGASRTGWVFPRNVERHLLAACQGKRVLHLFGGRSRFGVRLDIDPSTGPDVVGDAWLPPFRRDSFHVVVLDPPYIRLNSQMKNALLRAAGRIAKERVVWFSTMWISAESGLSCEAAWLVRVGDNCHVRCLQYFAVREKREPVKRFKRGPAMKYNRWLAQPHSLPLYDVSDPVVAREEGPVSTAIASS